MAKKHRSRKSLYTFKLGFFIACLIATYLIASTQFAHPLLDKLLLFKAIGAFFAGVLYTSILTTPLAIIFLYFLAGHMDPLLLAGIGGVGAMLGDIFIIGTFRAIVHYLFPHHHHYQFAHNLAKFFKDAHLDLLAMILGAIFIALPFPDELGLALLGASNLPMHKLMLLIFVLNSLGIFAIVSTATLLK